MVKAWIADITPLYDEERYYQCYEKLPTFRRKKADMLRTAVNRAQSVGVWTLWEKIRAEYGLPESSVFNLSHSGNYVLCVADVERTDVKVGCDLECVGEFREKVARRYFCREEYEAIMDAAPEERADMFYRFWVLKESFMKATRRGMALPTDSFQIRLGSPPVLLSRPDEFKEEYFYMEYRNDKLPCKIAVCTTDRLIDARLHTEMKL